MVTIANDSGGLGVVRSRARTPTYAGVRVLVSAAQHLRLSGAPTYGGAPQRLRADAAGILAGLVHLDEGVPHDELGAGTCGEYGGSVRTGGGKEGQFVGWSVC